MDEKILKVGAAKLDISPTPDMLPIDLSFSGDKYEAVREGEGITVRAIIIDNGEERFLFEAFEMGGVPDPDRLHALLMENFGIDRNHVLLNGTHNHAAPHIISHSKGGMSMPIEETENLVRYTDRVISQSVEVVRLAIENMKPAMWAFGEDKSYININRDEHFDDGYWMQGKNWEGCSDKTLAALKFVDYDGNLIAAVLNYAMHSVMNFCAKDIDGKVKISSSIPGVACNFLEDYFGNGAVVLWQSGAAGNQNPYFAYCNRYDKNGTMYFHTNEVPGATYANAVALGEQHAIDALRALKKTDDLRKCMPIRTYETMIELPGQRFPEGIDRAYHRLMVDNILVDRGYYKPGERYEKKLVEMIPIDEKVPMRAQLIVLGDMAFFGVACELYNEIAMLCKEASPLKKLVITTHIGYPSVGYVLDDASKGHKVFQSFGLVREGESNALVVNGMMEMFDKAFYE